MNEFQKASKYVQLGQYLVSIILLMLSTPLHAKTSLEQYAWDKRITLIFAQSNKQARVNQIRNIWEAHECDVRERHLIIGYLFYDDVSSLNGQLLSQHEALELRNKFRANPTDFSVVLIGKDGGAKHQEDRFDIKTIFALIDGMPMRQREMLEEHNCDI